VVRCGRCQKANNHKGAREKQLEKAEVLLRLTKGCLVPSEAYLMEAEVHLRSAKELLEAVETRLAPKKAPPVSTEEAVVGTLDPGESVRGPQKGKAWSLQKWAWCLPGEARASQNATDVHRSET
jgi:hypothetical protein